MSVTNIAEPEPVVKRSRARIWLVRATISIGGLVLFLLLVAIFFLLHFNIPSNTAGLAAQTLCSAKFVSGRTDDQVIFDQDIRPQSPAFALVSAGTDSESKSATGHFLGMFERTASLLPGRGCVLDEAPDPAAVAYSPAPTNPQPWPAGDAALPPTQWGSGVNTAGLEKVADQVFNGAGDPDAANARGFAVVQNGKLLIDRQAPGFQNSTPLLGWSMTKTMNAMLFYKRVMTTKFDMNTYVVDAFPAGRAPDWVQQWRQDPQKSKITVADVVFMRTGLDMEDDYGPTARVVQMLYGEPSMSGYAASQPMLNAPGTTWAYSTGTSDILSAITRATFATDQQYWAYAQQELFAPIGVKTGTFATDTDGTWVGGSYMWADTADWARLGQLMLNDGNWNGQQVIPSGWWKLASTPAMPQGDGHGYGAQTWIPGQPGNGECSAYPGVPADTLSMDGHYGQVVAMIPSRNAVIVRLGWTIDSSKFDQCQLISDVVANLAK